MVKPRLLLCTIALGFGVCLGWGLPVPDTIKLPDSLGPLRPDYHLAFGSSTDNIYVASESSGIMVVDGSYGGTFQRIKRINTGTPVGGALLVSQHNRLYCSYPKQGRIGVIDCATNTIVGTIPVGTCPTSFCYSSSRDKLYCGDTIDQTISVVDCATNTVLKVISVGNGLTAMAYDPTTDQVFAATQAAVRAISCSSDSIVASINAITAARGLLVNKRRQKLYVVEGHFWPCPDTELYVVSTKTDSLIHPIVYTTGWDTLARYLACNEATDRLYAFGTSKFNWAYEFDCSADTYTRQIDGVGGTCVGSACDTFRNRVYFLTCVTDAGYLQELDCSTWTYSDWAVGNYRYGSNPVLGLDPARYRLMCAGGDSDVVYHHGMLDVFDCKHDSTYERGAVLLSGWRYYMCHNPATGELYYAWGDAPAGGLGVIDEQTNRLVSQTFLPEGVTPGNVGMAYSRTSNKFYYWAFGEGLGVMDGARDSFLKVIPIGGCELDPCPRWCPDGNKVYCFDPTPEIDVVDCNTDSVVRQMDVSGLVRWFEYLDNDRMLCNESDSLALIDTHTDSVLVDSALTEPVYAVAHTGDGEKVYLARGDRLEARSSRSLSPLATIVWPSFDCTYGTFLVCSDSTHKLYWFAQQPDSVLAIDTRSDTVTARLENTYGCNRACLDHSGRYLFCSSYYDSTLRVYDTHSDSLVGLYSHLPYPVPVAVTSSPEQHCIYVGCNDVILAYPDAPPGVEETPNAEVRTTNRIPTIIHGVLCLPLASGVEREASSVLLDITGRKVFDLRPGSNDVRSLAPGVYFIREKPQASSLKPQTVRKIVIAN